MSVHKGETSETAVETHRWLLTPSYWLRTRLPRVQDRNCGGAERGRKFDFACISLARHAVWRKRRWPIIRGQTTGSSRRLRLQPQGPVIRRREFGRSSAANCHRSSCEMVSFLLFVFGSGTSGTVDGEDSRGSVDAVVEERRFEADRNEAKTWTQGSGTLWAWRTIPCLGAARRNEKERERV